MRPEQSLYLEGLSALGSALSKEPTERVASAEAFREGSKPNTQGIFTTTAMSGTCCKVRRTPGGSSQQRPIRRTSVGTAAKDRAWNQLILD